MGGYSVFVYAYRVSLGVSERQPNTQFTLSLARADRFQAGLSPLSIIFLWSVLTRQLLKSQLYQSHSFTFIVNWKKKTFVCLEKWKRVGFKR